MDPRLQWAFKQSARQLIKLGAKFNKWRADTTIKIPEMMRDFSKLTKIKWDDKVIDVVTSVVRIWKPLFKWISKQDQNIIDKMEKKLEQANKELPNVKAQGLIYQEEQRKAKEEQVQAQRNINTEQKSITMEDIMSKRRKKSSAVKQVMNSFVSKGKQAFQAAKAPKGVKFGSDDYIEAMYSQKKAAGVLTPQEELKYQLYKQRKGENDLGWYTQGGILNSINMPQFLMRKGTLYEDPLILASARSSTISSVAGIHVSLLLGKTDQNAFHIATQKLYSNLRRANTGASLYTISDLECYLLNLLSLIGIDRYLRRAYGVLMKYDSLDSTKPISFFKAMGLDFDTFKENMSNLRLLLNQNATRIHSLMAGKFAATERRAWLFDNIFLDGKTEKSQEYMFVTDVFKYYDWSSSTFKTATLGLFTENANDTGRTYAQSIAVYTTMINQALSSEKVAYISADIIKAYGLGQVDTYFNMIPENYTVSPVYNEEVLNEIQNSKLCGLVDSINYTKGDVVDEAVVLSTASFAGNTNGPDVLGKYFNQNIINFYKNDINIAEYAAATRFTVTGHLPADNKVILDNYGTEIVSYIDIITNVSEYGTMPTALYGLQHNSIYPWRSFSLANPSTGLLALTWIFRLIAMFDWFPAYGMATVVIDVSGTLTTFAGYGHTMLDYDNFAVLNDPLQIANIHSAVISSLYYYDNVIKDQRVIELK